MSDTLRQRHERHLAELVSRVYCRSVLNTRDLDTAKKALVRSAVADAVRERLPELLDSLQEVADAVLAPEAKPKPKRKSS